MRSENTDLSQLLRMAEEEGVLVVTQDDHEFILAEADDFEVEVEALRKSARFQAFLDRRAGEKTRISIEDIEKEIAQELGGM